jgi:hypothetical protein
MEEPVVEPAVELTKPPEPVPDVYQYVPTEPVVFAPSVAVISPQQEIDELREMVKALMAKLK